MCVLSEVFAFTFQGCMGFDLSQLLWTRAFGVRADLLIGIFFMNKAGATRKECLGGQQGHICALQSMPAPHGPCHPHHSPGPCQRFKGV